MIHAQNNESENRKAYRSEVRGVESALKPTEGEIQARSQKVIKGKRPDSGLSGCSLCTASRVARTAGARRRQTEKKIFAIGSVWGDVWGGSSPRWAV